MKNVVFPSWLIVLVFIIVVLIVSGGGYKAFEYKLLKDNYKDSLELRKVEIFRLEEIIYNAENFEDSEVNNTDLFRDRYYKELKKRKDAEKKLFIFTNNSRRYNDSIMSNYKFRR